MLAESTAGIHWAAGAGLLVKTVPAISTLAVGGICGGEHRSGGSLVHAGHVNEDQAGLCAYERPD